MGVNVLPLLCKLLIKGPVNPGRVHVVAHGDDEVASVPQTKVSHCICNLKTLFYKQ